MDIKQAVELQPGQRIKVKTSGENWLVDRVTAFNHQTRVEVIIHNEQGAESVINQDRIHLFEPVEDVGVTEQPKLEEALRQTVDNSTVDLSSDDATKIFNVVSSEEGISASHQDALQEPSRAEQDIEPGKRLDEEGKTKRKPRKKKEE